MQHDNFTPTSRHAPLPTATNILIMGSCDIHSQSRQIQPAQGLQSTQVG